MISRPRPGPPLPGTKGTSVKQNSAISVGIVAGFAACGAGWALLPALQTHQQQVDRDVAVHVERARRLLHQYRPEFTRQTLLLDELRGLDIDPSDPDALTDEARDEFQRVHGQLWTSFQPHDWTQDPPREVRASYGDIPSEMKRGLGARQGLAEANDRLLGDSLTEVDLALAVTSGNESGRSNVGANDLKAAIHYYQGVAESLRARAIRRMAAPYMTDLAYEVARAITLEPRLTLFADTGIDGQMAAIREQIAEQQEQVRQLSDEAARLDDLIEELEHRLADAEARRAAAQDAMRRLIDQGADLADPQGAKAFRSRMLAQDQAFREAERDVAAIQTGDYTNAQIDVSGDYLRGRYVENGSTQNLTIEPGLLHYRDRRQIVADRTAGTEAALDNLRTDLQRLQALAGRLEATERDARTQMDDAKEAARAAYDGLNRINSEAFAIEESALAYFDKAARAAQQAASAGQEWTSSAGERAQRIPPAAQDRSAFKERQNDGWMAGYSRAKQADANLARAWIFLDRYRAATTLAATLSDFPESIRLGEADAEAESTKAADARDAGVEEIKQAMTALERAHRDADRHWAIVAQAAGANYLMALLGRAEYLPEAIQAYRTALQGREDAKFVEPLAIRLKQLEARQ
jgi:hypothetical protein